MTKISFVLSLLLLSGAATKEAPRPVATLDLRGVVPQLREREAIAGSTHALGIGPGTNRDQKPSRSNAAVAIAILNAAKTRYGLTISLLIQNTSAHDITLPWSPHPRSIERKEGSYHFQTMTLDFAAREPDGSWTPLRSWFVLYGSEATPKTTLRLHPNQSAVVLRDIPVTSSPKSLKATLVLSDSHFFVKDDTPSQDTTELVQTESPVFSSVEPQQ